MMWKKNNLFGFLAFTAYGFFWLSLTLLLLLPLLGVKPASGASMGTYMLSWCIFTIGMTVGTFAKAYRALSVLFVTVIILFWLLSVSYFCEEEHKSVDSCTYSSKDWKKAAGIEGSICGFIAIYCAFGEFLNETWGRTILPLGI
jgi:succinate-acetate transporter protein